MKVIFFDFTTMVGGATKGTVYLLERLKKEGLDASIIDVYGNCQEYLEDIKKANICFSILKPQNENIVIGHLDDQFKRLLIIARQTPTFFIIFCKLYKLLRKEKPDYLLVNNDKSLFFLSLLKKFFNFKIILYYRGEANKKQMSNRFVTLVNKFVDIKYCHSKKAISNMKEHGVKGNVVYLPNCISLNLIRDIKLEDLSGKKCSFSVLLSAGRVVEEKGYHTAIEAIGLLRQKGYNLKLLLPGLIVDRIYIERLEKLIQKYDLKKSVEFIGWVDNVTQILASADFMVLPSYTEGFPRSIIEAMLLKIPVCATPVGGVPEAIFHEKTGYLFNVNDAHGLANSLQILIDSFNQREKIVKNAYNFAIENFDEQKNTQIFLENLK